MARKTEGKYAGVLHKLQKRNDYETPAYKLRIEAAKLEIKDAYGASPAELAKHYRFLREQKDELDAQMSRLNAEIEAASELLVESQEQESQLDSEQRTAWGLYGAAETTLRLANGDAFRVQVEPYTSTEDRDQLREFFLESDLKRLLSPPWQTVNSLNKERLLAGEAEIPGTKLYLKSKIVFTPMKTESIDETVKKAAKRAAGGEL